MIYGSVGQGNPPPERAGPVGHLATVQAGQQAGPTPCASVDIPSWHKDGVFMPYLRDMDALLREEKAKERVRGEVPRVGEIEHETRSE